MTSGDIIFLSASVPYRPAWRDDAKPSEIEEAILSLARAVFARGGRLLFGGHPSISPFIAAIASEYFPIEPRRTVRPIVTFQSEHYRGQVPDQTWDLFRMGWSAIEWTPEREDTAASLRLMREWMLLDGTPPAVIERNAITPPLAMVAIGGMEGVRDEAAMFLRARRSWHPNRPRCVFAAASGGGAATRLSMRPETWERRLFVGQPTRDDDRSELVAGSAQGAIVGIESHWHSLHPDHLPKDAPFEPYAAMMQSLVDGLTVSKGNA